MARAAEDEGRPKVCLNHNLHSIYLCQRNEQMRKLYRISDLTFVDGIGAIAYARLSSNIRIDRRDRATYLDWLDEFLRLADQKEMRVMHIGLTSEQAKALGEKVREKFTGIDFLAEPGYFALQGAESEQLLVKILDFKPNVIMAGMGMPRQELWIEQSLPELPPCLVLTSGAALAYFADFQRTPPRWSGRLGIEWAFRLAYNPRRLWRRYLIEPVQVLSHLLCNWNAKW